MPEFFAWFPSRPGATVKPSTRLVNEGSLRFRFNQGNLLLGGRVGIRVAGFAKARFPLIFEFGTGAF
jgi:hypothetical protein